MIKTHPEAGFGAEWTEYVEQRINDTQNVATTSSGIEQFQFPENYKRGYFETQPEILEFIKEYDINQQKRHLACLRDDSAFLNAVEEELDVAGTWVDEAIEKNASGVHPNYY